MSSMSPAQHMGQSRASCLGHAHVDVRLRLHAFGGGLPWTVWLHHPQGVRASPFSSDPSDAGLTKAASPPCRAHRCAWALHTFLTGSLQARPPTHLLVPATCRSTSPSDPPGERVVILRMRSPSHALTHFPPTPAWNTIDGNVLAERKVLSGLFPRKQPRPSRASREGVFLRSEVPGPDIVLRLVLKQN